MLIPRAPMGHPMMLTMSDWYLTIPFGDISALPRHDPFTTLPLDGLLSVGGTFAERVTMQHNPFAEVLSSTRQS